MDCFGNVCIIGKGRWFRRDKQLVVSLKACNDFGARAYKVSSGRLTEPWKIPIFPGKFHKSVGFSMAMLIYRSVL